MSTLALYSKIEELPDSLKKQVLDYIEFLLSREGKDLTSQELKQQEAQTNVKAGFGGAKGMFSMSPDFDEPLEYPKAKKAATKKPLKAGFLKGSFIMADDFEAPLEDFNEYM
ncbi:MAG: DUF2281 domain-containing protein [Saprospiraceae bacterium]|nr:DUF2281 domain-containing protein [Saprospiraceae bacterium]